MKKYFQYTRETNNYWPNLILLKTIDTFGKFTVKLIKAKSTGRSFSNVLYGFAHIDLQMTVASTVMSTNPVINSDYTFMYKTPEFQVLQTFFLDVFTPQFWFASLGITFLIVLFGWIFNKSRPSSEEEPSLILLSAFVLTSAGILPTTKRFTFRFYLLVVGLFSFMFGSAFHLFLTSFLSTQTAILPFQTVDGILEDGTYSLCMDSFSTLSLKFSDKKWDAIKNNEKCPTLEQWIFEDDFNAIKHVCENRVVIGTASVLAK